MGERVVGQPQGRCRLRVEAGQRVSQQVPELGPGGVDADEQQRGQQVVDPIAGGLGVAGVVERLGQQGIRAIDIAIGMKQVDRRSSGED